MSNQRLEQIARVSKALSIVVNIIIPLLVVHSGWSSNWIADAQFVWVAALSLLPNRWVVFSRASYVISLILSLFPLRFFFDGTGFLYKSYMDWQLLMLGFLISAFVFCPLPLSLVLSRIRLRRGDKFIFA